MTKKSPYSRVIDLQELYGPTISHMGPRSR